MKLNDYEKEVFCRVALKIAQKGHLTIEAIVKFCKRFKPSLCEGLDLQNMSVKKV
ncbi:MAG: hypothetical protein ACE5KT_10525 [Methanosarcinales archaeon]